MDILAVMIINNRKYVLTIGYGSADFKQAKKLSDFAVYYDDESISDDKIASSGHKASRKEAVQLFGGAFNLEKEDFRV